MTKLRNLSGVALPVGITLFCWLSMRTVVTNGSESQSLYGFPLAWYAPSPAASMAYEIALWPWAIDLLLYVAAAFLACRPLMARGPRTMPGKAVVMLLCVVAAASLAWMALALAFDVHAVAWTLDGYYSDAATRTHGLQIGPGRS
jgi:hypothetical protein